MARILRWAKHWSYVQAWFSIDPYNNFKLSIYSVGHSGSTVELKLNRTYITCTYSRAGLIILTILYPCRPNFNIQENIYDRLLKKFICCKKCTHTIIWNFIPLHAKIATHAKFEYIDVAWEIFWSFKIKKVLKFSFPEETKGHNK